MLPPEIKFQILGHLATDPKDLATCCRLNKEWNEIANDELLCKSHVVCSLEEITKRIQDFVAQIPLDTVGEFTCFFPLTPGCIVQAACGLGKIDLLKTKGEAGMKEKRAFKGKLGPNAPAQHPIEVSYYAVHPDKKTAYYHCRISLPVNVPSEKVALLSKEIKGILKQHIEKLQNKN